MQYSQQPRVESDFDNELILFHSVPPYCKRRILLGPNGFAGIFQSLTTVRYWMLNGLPCISDDELEVLGSCCPVIETLELINSGIPIPAHNQPTVYPSIIKTGKSVSAHAVNCKRGDKLDEVTDRNCAKLKSTMQSFKRITDRCLSNVTRKGLRRLLVSDLQEFDGKCFDISSTQPSQQVPVQMNSEHLRSEMISNAATTEHLTQLSLLNCSRVSDALLHHLVSLPYLTVLNLSGCTKLTDVAVKQMTDSSYATFLRELYLTGCDKLTDRSMLAMSGKLNSIVYMRRSCKNLQHLKLLYCKSWKKQDINRLTGGIAVVEHSNDEAPTCFNQIIQDQALTI
ncbi:hypothetical protein AHF37_04096 [Paragonimus kellicotti]|nr:hypothetical protein AHF37_04096 [Paragonimus kellicotti]